MQSTLKSFLVLFHWWIISEFLLQIFSFLLITAVTLQHKSHLATANFPWFLAIPLLNRVTKELLRHLIVRCVQDLDSYCAGFLLSTTVHAAILATQLLCSMFNVLRWNPNFPEFFWFSGILPILWPQVSCTSNTWTLHGNTSLVFSHYDSIHSNSFSQQQLFPSF